MHSVSFYSFRILEKKGSKKSRRLDDLKKTNGNSAFVEVESFLKQNTNKAINRPLSKSLIFLDGKGDLTINSNRQLIHGYVKVGKYGESAEITDTTLGTLKLKTLIDDITLRERYILLYLPDGFDEGFVAIHSNDNISARTVLFESIIQYFKDNYDLEARFNPLCHKKIPDYILDSEVKEIKAIGFETPSDVADSFGQIKTHIHSDLVIKHNEGFFGSFRDLNNKKIGNVIEIIDEQCDEVKVTLRIGSRDIVFKYSSILKKGISAELDDSDINIDASTGIPNVNDLHNTIVDISNEILLDIHSQNQGVII